MLPRPVHSCSVAWMEGFGGGLVCPKTALSLPFSPTPLYVNDTQQATSPAPGQSLVGWGWLGTEAPGSLLGNSEVKWSIKCISMHNTKLQGCKICIKTHRTEPKRSLTYIVFCQHYLKKALIIDYEAYL